MPVTCIIIAIFLTAINTASDCKELDDKSIFLQLFSIYTIFYKTRKRKGYSDSHKGMESIGNDDAILRR
jgi:hypothetical protein